MSNKTLVSQNFIKELTIPEHIILWLNVLLSTSFLIVQLAWLKAYDKWTTWLSFVATIVSIFAVMAGAKKRILCPLLGLLASILLIAVSWGQHLYGSMIMYGCNIIIQACSLVSWIKNSKNRVSIEPKHCKWKWAIIYLVGLIGLSALFTWVEGIPGFAKFWSGNKDATPERLAIRIFDSINLIFTLGCIVPMIKRYDQVWWMYIICDLAIAIVWMLKGIYSTSSSDQFIAWTMMASGICMTATCVLGIISWQKSLHTNKKTTKTK